MSFVKGLQNSKIHGTAPTKGMHFEHCLNRPHNVASEFISLCKSLGLKLSALKSGARHPSLLFATHKGASTESRLVIAGTHGDEPAGVLGILNFLKSTLEKGTLKDYPPFAIIPLVSPTAFGLGKRNNAWNENANRGYYITKTHCREATGTPSREGRTLLENIQTLLKHSQAGALSLHEDVDSSEFYLYAYENSTAAGSLSHHICDLGSSHFGRVPDLDNFEGSKIRDGIIFNDFGTGALDESLHLNGSPLVLVTETPGKQNLATRAHANALITEQFLLGDPKKQ